MQLFLKNNTFVAGHLSINDQNCLLWVKNSKRLKGFYYWFQGNIQKG